STLRLDHPECSRQLCSCWTFRGPYTASPRFDCDCDGIEDADELAGNDCDSDGVLDRCAIGGSMFFEPVGPVATPEFAVALATADLNQDGRTDVIATVSEVGNVNDMTVLRGQAAAVSACFNLGSRADYDVVTNQPGAASVATGLLLGGDTKA